MAILDFRALTVSELARILNGGKLGTVISERRLRLLHTRAGIRVGPARSVDFFRFMAWLADEAHGPKAEAAAEAAKQRGTEDEDDEKAWKYWRARMAELDFMQKSGRFVPIEDRDALLASRASEFRRGLEGALLHRLPPRLAVLDDPGEIAEVLEGVIRELMEKYCRPCS